MTCFSAFVLCSVCSPRAMILKPVWPRSYASTSSNITDEFMRSGMPREEACRRARIEFGGVNSVKEDCRQARGLHPFDELQRELRYASRLLRKTPAFTAAALLTLALCLGANLTIFAVIDAILLRPLPFPDSGRLVTVFNTYPKAAWTAMGRR